MRNLRKLTAAVLAAAFALTSLTTVFAADSATIANADKAAALKDLGLYAGKDANDPNVGLEDALTTQDSLIFLAKLFGYYDDATELSARQVTEALAKFDDAASISEYAKNVVAYSAANGILSGSTKDGKFFVGAKDTVTAARFATFMLKQMGYDNADNKLSVAKLAETKGSKVDATLTGDLTRDAAVGAMYGALTAEKVSGKTIIADIVGDNADLKTKAEKLGLIAAPVPTYVAVESVRALNCKQIEIVFNQEMAKDSAESEAFYEIYNKGSNKVILSDSSASLGADKKTVTITLNKNVDDKLTNSSKAKVVVQKDIIAGNGTKLAEDAVFDDVVVEDGIIPTVTSVKDTGEKNIRITFSEPVYDKGIDNSIATTNFKIESGTYQYFVQKATLDNNVINLELGTKLIEGPVNVTVNDAGIDAQDAIVDYAGYVVFKSTTTFDYVKDASVSVVTVKSATKNKIVLSFSKPVKGSNIRLYHSNENVEAYKANATATDYVEEITFIFSEPMPSGKVKLYLVNSDTEKEKLVDGYGIKVPDQTLTCDVKGVSPVVTVNSAKKNKVVLSFSKPVKGSNISLYHTNKDVESNKAEATATDYVNEITFIYSSSLPVGQLDLFLVNSENEGEKLIDREGILVPDQYLTCEVEEEPVPSEKSDTTPPQVINDPENDRDCCSIAEKGWIYIVYSEAMNELQMLDKANYMVSIDEGETYWELGDDDTITKVNDRTVKIYFKEFEGNDSNPFVKIAPIMDLAWNRLNGSIGAYTVEDIEPENVHIEQAQLIAKNKIKLIFNKKMGNIDINDFLIESTTQDAISVDDCELQTVNSDGKTEVVLILNIELTTDGKDESGNFIAFTTVENPSSESEWGGKLKSDFRCPDDKIAPEIVMWDHDNDESTANIAKVIASGDIADPAIYDNDFNVPQNTTGTITIYFSEAINNMDPALTTNTFLVDGFTITNISASYEDKTVILEVRANANNTHVKTTVTQVYNIKDIFDNVFHSGSQWTVTLDDSPTD